MKILFVNTLYYPFRVGGAERSVQQLAEALVREGHQVVVATTSPEREDSVADVNGVRVYYLRLRNLYWPPPSTQAQRLLRPLWHLWDTANLAMTKQVRALVKREQPDLVNTNNLVGFSPLVWKALYEMQIPILQTLRGYDLLCPRTTMFRKGRNCQVQCWDCRAFSWLPKRLSRYVTGVIGVSRSTLQIHLNCRYFPRAAVREVVFNPVEATVTPDSKPPAHYGMFHFGYLGRLDPAKGVEKMLAAARKLPDGEWSLLVAGSGREQYTTRLRQYFISPRIQYLGHMEPNDFFRRIDALIVPSLWNEPMGRVILEAYSYGVPVVAARRGGIAEIVEEGRTGFLYDPEETGGLAQAVRKFIEHPERARAMRPACLAKATEFLPEKIVKQFLEICERVIGDVRSVG